VVLLLCVFVGLLVVSPEQLALIILSMLTAMSPDVVWIYRFVVQESWGKKKPGPLNVFNRFHANIQWGERHYGWLFELAWFFAISTVLISYLV
jgi:hypothetical protein